MTSIKLADLHRMLLPSKPRQYWLAGQPADRSGIDLQPSANYFS